MTAKFNRQVIRVTWSLSSSSIDRWGPVLQPEAQWYRRLLQSLWSAYLDRRSFKSLITFINSYRFFFYCDFFSLFMTREWDEKKECSFCREMVSRSRWTRNSPSTHLISFRKQVRDTNNGLAHEKCITGTRCNNVFFRYYREAIDDGPAKGTRHEGVQHFLPLTLIFFRMERYGNVASRWKISVCAMRRARCRRTSIENAK